MRTPAVHFWGLNSWTFWKTEPNLDFLKNREISCHHPFKKRPQLVMILSGYFKEKVWALHLYCVRSEAWNVDTSRPRPVGLSLGRTLGFCHWGDMAVVLQSFSQQLRGEIVDRNNNCAVVCTRTVEVLKRLIGGATEGQGRATVLADVTS